MELKHGIPNMELKHGIPNMEKTFGTLEYADDMVKALRKER